MRVAIFTGNYNHIADGVSLTLNRLVDFLEKQGITVQVYGPSVLNPPVKHAGNFYEVPSIPLLGRPEYRISIGMGIAARNRLDYFKPDIIHIATPDILGLMGLKYGINNNIPVVSTYHTHFASYLKYYKIGMAQSALWKYLKWFYGNCRELYVPSDSMKNVLEDVGLNTRIKIWERGIETERFHPRNRSEAWRTKYGFGKDDKVVLFVSRVVKEKGTDTIIETYGQTASDVKWCIVGDGPEKEVMQRKMPNAVFCGKLHGKELSEAYASSDVFFFPSDTETFGNVTLEAMASGLPCIVANATGSKSLVENEKNGYLGNSTDHQQFAQWILKLAENDQIRSDFALTSRNKAEEYDWNIILNKMMTYYHQLLDQQKPKMVA